LPKAPKLCDEPPGSKDERAVRRDEVKAKVKRQKAKEEEEDEKSLLSTISLPRQL
jgi:hypothetical protein